DAVQFDRAYLDYSLPETSFGLRSGIIAGKMENPFRWGKGPDTLTVDQDLGFEGVTLKERLNLSENAWLFATAGGYVIQEFASHADPKLMGVQVGAGFRPARDWEVGIRASSFFFRSLNSTDGAPGNDFRDRALGGGNLSTAFANGKTRIG